MAYAVPGSALGGKLLRQLAEAAATCDEAAGKSWWSASRYGRIDLAEVCCTADSVLSEQVRLLGGQAKRFSDWNGYNLTKVKDTNQLETIFLFLWRQGISHPPALPPGGCEMRLRACRWVVVVVVVVVVGGGWWWWWWCLAAGGYDEGIAHCPRGALQEGLRGM